jgi:hypothetical protein
MAAQSRRTMTRKRMQRQVWLPSTVRQSLAHCSRRTTMMKRTQRQVQLSSTKLQRLQSIHSRARSDLLAPSFEYVVSLCPSYECVCSCDRGLGQSGRELLIERKPPPVPVRTEAFEIVWMFSSNNCKYFIFNKDNIVIMSIENAGRMRLCDIRSLTDLDGRPLTHGPRVILGNPPRQIEVTSSQTHRSPWVLLILQELTRDKI